MPSDRMPPAPPPSPQHSVYPVYIRQEDTRSMPSAGARAGPRHDPRPPRRRQLQQRPDRTRVR